MNVNMKKREADVEKLMELNDVKSPYFDLGELKFSEDILLLCGQNESVTNGICEFFKRHVKGDWGNLSEEDIATNNYAFEQMEGMILSSYEHQLNDVHTIIIWVITESDRSVTTILLPQEY